MKFWTRIVPSFITAVAVSLFVRRYLHGTFPAHVVEGLAFWAMFVALYPVDVYFARKGHGDATPFRRPSFFRCVLAAGVGALFIAVMHYLIGW